MTSEPEGSITRWIGELQAGARIDEATQGLWERYYDRLVHLARARLRDAPRGPADEEDAALSAFDSFCRGVAAGRFPRLGSRDDLWRILVTITRKAADQIRDERRQKRGGGRLLGEAALVGAEDGAVCGFEAIAGREPSPEFAALVADEVRLRLAELRDESLRRVALLRLEGYDNGDIAALLECSVQQRGAKGQADPRCLAQRGRAVSDDTPGRASGPAALPLADRVNLACDRYEAERKAGRQTKVEDYLVEVPEPERPAFLRELLRLELDYRVRDGERPTPAEYRERIPDQAPVIDSVFARIGTDWAAARWPALPPRCRPWRVTRSSESWAGAAWGRLQGPATAPQPHRRA